MGFVIAISWSHESLQTAAAGGRRARLATLATARQQRVRGLERQLADLRRRLDRELRASRHGRLGSLSAERDRLALLAGIRPVRGEGIEVLLSDSPPEERPPADAGDFEIQDVDIQLVVNQLWALGAEAVAVNGQRMIATSAIRSAGGTILVNYRVLTSPYRIVAIGPARALDRRFRATALARRFRGWVDIYHLGFTVKMTRNVSVPAFGGSVHFRYADPAAALR